ncbi:MAG: hypothetical protein MUQ32_04500 [Chloroflexi bacterium]|nr:hypothetical protein [Chloroflexota bacterium]
MTSHGTVDGQAAILEIDNHEGDQGSGEVGLVLYIEPIDKEHALTWRGPGEVLADVGGGFSVAMKGAPISAAARALGPAFLEASWTCGD